MKKSIIISLVIAITATVLSAKETVVNTPLQVAFADKLVDVFGGNDNVLSEAEMVRVLDFLQANLPEKTSPTILTNRLSREYNLNNTARGDITIERHSLREEAPEVYVTAFINKYDVNEDNYVTKQELANALTNVIGLPKNKAGLNKGSVAKR